MSIIRTAVLCCDYDDCPQWLDGADTLAPALREQAQDAGWTRPTIDGKRVDWCDRHAPTRAQP